MSISRIALPIVELARFPGPKRLLRQLMSSSLDYRTVDDDQYAGSSQAGRRTYEIEGWVQNGLRGCKDHGKVLG